MASGVAGRSRLSGDDFRRFALGRFSFSADDDALRRDLFLDEVGIGVSGGSNPSSTEMAIAFGMESQLLPVGEIHFRRRRFYIVTVSLGAKRITILSGQCTYI